MTALRQKMIEAMQLHSFSERTQDSYLRAVRQLAAYFNAVQFVHTRSQEHSSGIAVGLKFQTVRLLS